MTAYPNKEHANADRAARRRALEALAELTSEAALLRRALAAGGRDLDGDDTQVLAGLVRKLTRDLSVLGTLRDVREWHEADEAATAAGEVGES